MKGKRNFFVPVMCILKYSATFPTSKQGLIIFTNVDDGYKVYNKLLKHYLGSYGEKIIEIEAK